MKPSTRRKISHAARLFLRQGSALARLNLIHAIAYNLLPNPIKPRRVRHHPISYTIYVNNLCNYRCSFCFLINEENPGDSSRNIGEEQFLRIVHHPLNRYAQRVTLGGGEPFLHPQLFHFVDVLKKTRRIVSIYTNGSLLHKHLEDLNRCPPDALNVSHYDNEFPSIESVLREISAARRGTRIRLSKLLDARKFSIMQEMIELCLGIGIPGLIFQNYFPRGNRSPELVIRDDNVEYRREQRRLEQLYRRAPIEIIWPNLLRNGQRFGCQNLALNLTYDGQGNIAPCCFLVPPDPVRGNLFESRDPWNSPALEVLRQEYGKKKTRNPACAHCYFQYGLQNRNA